MLSHVFIGISDFERAFNFYNAVLDELDLTLKFVERERPWAGWMKKDEARPLFLIGTPENGEACSPGNGPMVALLAPTREAVDLTYQTALENGGSCEGKPGLRPHYHPDYYGAYFRDPDGNKIGIVCHDPL